MSLATRLTALAQAVGADIKDIRSKIATSAAAYNQGNYSSAGTPAANTWVTMPIGIGGGETIDPDGAFVRSGDGSVTVVNAGWYEINASAQASAVSCALQVSIGTAPNALGLLALDGDSASASAFARASTSCSVKLTAGQKIFATGLISVASVALTLTAFSIARVGGPQGAKGDAGLGSGFNVVDLAAATSYTISGLDGDLDFGYEFYLMGSIPAGSVARNCVIVPNALVTPANAALKSYRTGFYRENNALTADNLVSDGIGFVIAPAYTVTALATINTHATLVSRTGSERACKAEFEVTDASTIFRILHGTSVSKWTDTATKITSLRFVSDGAFTGKLFWRKMLA